MGKNNEKNDEIILSSPEIQIPTFAKRFRGDDAKEVYNAVISRISKDFENAPIFNSYFKFNEETQEINGSDLYHGILINDELRKNGLYLPSVIEGKALDASEKLTNGFYRDYGIAVYSNNSPNSELAMKLVEEADKRTLELSLLVPFSALKLGKVADKNVPVLLREEIKGIMTGEQTQKYLDEHFNRQGNSGVQRSGRGGDGDWGANWNILGGSGDDGRMDWVCWRS